MFVMDITLVIIDLIIGISKGVIVGKIAVISVELGTGAVVGIVIITAAASIICNVVTVIWAFNNWILAPGVVVWAVEWNSGRSTWWSRW